ncbi:MAG: hypothetical protein JWR08_1008, partial [Enterovirga sp.]|nr:hypothetical protein [Enterovirga sp.]
MAGEELVDALKQLIGAEATRYCIERIGGQLDAPFLGELATYEALAFFV